MDRARWRGYARPMPARYGAPQMSRDVKKAANPLHLKRLRGVRYGAPLCPFWCTFSKMMSLDLRVMGLFYMPEAGTGRAYIDSVGRSVASP